MTIQNPYKNCLCSSKNCDPNITSSVFDDGSIEVSERPQFRVYVGLFYI